MALITQNLTEPVTRDGTQGPWDLTAASWKTLESCAKYQTYESQ